jgi:hypothetical protein
VLQLLLPLWPMLDSQLVKLLLWVVLLLPLLL